MQSPAAHPPSVDAISRAGGAQAALASRCGLFAEGLTADARDLIAAWTGEGISVYPADDARLPQHLDAVPGAPALVFGRGHFVARDCSSVAVIGTRSPSPTGRRLAREVASLLTRDGITVMSGLAAGIDTEAHGAALEAGGRSIGVIGTGVNRTYPAENAALQARLDVVVSPFLPEAGPRREHFPLRNALMAALSQATVIIEAGPRSGVRIQARHALSQGRRLLLMAPVLSQDWARDLAKRDGVEVVEDAHALVDILTEENR